MAVATKFYWFDNNIICYQIWQCLYGHNTQSVISPCILWCYNLPAFISALVLNLHRTNDHSFIDNLTQNNVAVASNIVGGMHPINCLLFSSNIVLLTVKPMVNAVACGPVLFLRTIWSELPAATGLCQCWECHQWTLPCTHCQGMLSWSKLLSCVVSSILIEICNAKPVIQHPGYLGWWWDTSSLWYRGIPRTCQGTPVSPGDDGFFW